MSNIRTAQDPIQEEVYLARAITAVILAVKLDLAEEKGQVAYDKVINTSEVSPDAH